MSAFIRPEHSLQVLRPDALAAAYAADATSNERPQRSFSPMPETRELLLERSEWATGGSEWGFQYQHRLYEQQPPRRRTSIQRRPFSAVLEQIRLGSL